MNLYLVNEALHARLGRRKVCAPIQDGFADIFRFIAERNGVTHTEIMDRFPDLGRCQLSNWLQAQKKNDLLTHKRAVTGGLRWIRK